VRLSPADDLLIRVERALDLDSEGQLVASVLSKKIAAGSQFLVLDMPVGPTAKVRSMEAAEALSRSVRAVAGAFGLEARTIISDGRQPVGRGIGPALEARDVLAVLRGEPDAPLDLKSRAEKLAGALLELGGKAEAGAGESKAKSVIDSGLAWAKFQRICEAQGGMRTPPVSTYRQPMLSDEEGEVLYVDNRCLARIAKLAGAPDSKAAGAEIHVRLGDRVKRGQPLFTIHAETPGELAYALDYAVNKEDIVMRIGAR
jgi:thymidine phosphorylase